MRVACFLLILLSSAGMVTAQPRADSLSSAIDDAFGIDKLKLQHELIQEYFDSNDTKKALKLARQATALADRIISTENELVTEDDLPLKATTYFMMGKAYYKRKQYTYSENYLRQAIKASLELHRFDHIEDAERLLAKSRMSVQRVRISFSLN